MSKHCRVPAPWHSAKLGAAQRAMCHPFAECLLANARHTFAECTRPGPPQRELGKVLAMGASGFTRGCQVSWLYQVSNFLKLGISVPSAADEVLGKGSARSYQWLPRGGFAKCLEKDTQQTSPDVTSRRNVSTSPDAEWVLVAWISYLPTTLAEKVFSM